MYAITAALSVTAQAIPTSPIRDTCADGTKIPNAPCTILPQPHTTSSLRFHLVVFYDVHDETKLSTTVQIAGARTAYRMQPKSFSLTKQRRKGEERILIRDR